MGRWEVERRVTQMGAATGDAASRVSEIKSLKVPAPGAPLRIEEIAAIYMVGWKGALTQEGRFLAPRRVFEGITTGLDLIKEVSAFAPFLWIVEKKLKDDAIKAGLRNCYKAMKEEADTIWWVV
eukprot:Blabericola_migrator_1__10417@NODE_588_length_7453_cov_88_141348_g435_i0_p4_GENE_NODE_588_length_7453_cov_88_141348_g435_i0NODE_588_length_7453_cov_88_141348_g435_i0_p4_ORF_typecomplete_len124_score24_05ELH/PF02323_15/0_3_NODE_588_length_7453_cov_88_141348_g435_i012361607